LSKVSTFEKNPPTDYLKKICLPAVLLWPGYYGDVVNNAIANYTPATWQDVKLYESNGTLSRPTLISHLNQGYQFCHGAAHGSSSGWYYYYGSTLLNGPDAYSLTNGNKLTVVNSIACISGGFDMGDCQAEQFVLNPNGGAVASIQNSREGWGTPPSMGPSERLDAKFYSQLFWDHVFQIGATHAGSKDYFVSQAQADPYMRWCVYELNLFGDPNMPLWTEIPVAMTVNHPQSVPPGPQNFTVGVSDGGTPIEDALVCVMNSTVYEHGYTNSSGEITFSIDPSEDDTLQVTATAYNYFPYEGECLVTVGVEELSNDQLTMTNFQLYQNQPNPFSHSTTIQLSISNFQFPVSVKVYDLNGRLVKTLIDGPLPTPYSLLPTSVVWDGRDNYGREVAGGIYFCTMEAGELRATRSMVLLR
jgi:hypothetical protein